EDGLFHRRIKVSARDRAGFHAVGRGPAGPSFHGHRSRPLLAGTAAAAGPVTFAPTNSTGTPPSMSQPTFAKTAPVFVQRLREVTEAYFKVIFLRKTGAPRLYTKTAVLATALVSLYVVLVFFTPASAWLALG